MDRQFMNVGANYICHVVIIYFVQFFFESDVILNNIIYEQICEKGLIHTSNFSPLRLCNSACIGFTALKFSSRTVLPLHLKFQPNSLLINEVMSLQIWKIGCVYNAPFCKFSHICIWLQASYDKMNTTHIWLHHSYMALLP